jgi:hypothetical protein
LILLSSETKSKEAWESANKRTCYQLSVIVGWKIIFALFSVLRIFCYLKNTNVSNTAPQIREPILTTRLRSDTKLRYIPGSHRDSKPSTILAGWKSNCYCFCVPKGHGQEHQLRLVNTKRGVIFLEHGNLPEAVVMNSQATRLYSSNQVARRVSARF